MTIKKVSYAILLSAFIISSNLGASILKGHKCTLALIPFGNSISQEHEKDQILNAYKAKGYHVSVVSSLETASEFEYYADPSVECTKNYFGTSAITTIRVVEVASNKILSRVQTPAIQDLFNCKIELLKAIESLPTCTIR